MAITHDYTLTQTFSQSVCSTCRSLPTLSTLRNIGQATKQYCDYQTCITHNDHCAMLHISPYKLLYLKCLIRTGVCIASQMPHSGALLMRAVCLLYCLTGRGLCDFVRYPACHEQHTDDIQFTAFDVHDQSKIDHCCVVLVHSLR